MDVGRIFGADEAREQRFAIYIPNKDRDGQPIEQEIWVEVEVAIKLLSSINGGATAMPPVRGAWLNPDSGQLVIEEPVLVYSYIDPDPFEARVGELANLVHEIGRQTRQGQMAIEFDGVLYLIDIR